MRSDDLSSRLIVSLVVLLSAAPFQAQPGEESVSFGIFEVVDCATAGANAMLLKRGEETQKYCLAAKPIVNRAHLKDAKCATDGLGRPMLELTLTKPGGELMEKTTQRLVGEHSTTGERRSLGLVVNGKLLSIPTVMDVITDQLVVHGGWTKKEVDEIVAFLMGELPPGRPTALLN
jgi:preprotein translocase subunit SecD